MITEKVLNAAVNADMKKRQREAYGNDFGVQSGGGYRQRLEDAMKAEGIKEGTETWRTGIIANSSTNTEKVETPEFNPGGGTYQGEPGETFMVEITCASSGAYVRYTTNGYLPNEKSAIYTAPLSIDHSLTLKAIAYKDGMEQSDCRTEGYSILLGNDSTKKASAEDEIDAAIAADMERRRNETKRGGK